MKHKNRKGVIAYLSMEIALDDKLATYAGGLGVLAGDFLRSAADLNLPLVGVSLLNKHGYFRQTVDRKGRQEQRPEKNDFRKLKKMRETVSVLIGTETVTVGAWEYLMDGKLPIYLLDTDRPENKKKYRNITDHLYGRNKDYRLLQEIVLGRGGVKMLTALGYEVRKYHVNEGHGILSALELLSRIKGGRVALRRRFVFSNHTPVRSGQDIFSLSHFLAVQPDFPAGDLDLLDKHRVNLTRLGVKLAGRVNGVSKMHETTLKKEFPRDKICHITNGVHAAFWTVPEFAKLYDRYLPGWRKHNGLFKKAGLIPLQQINKAHQAAKRKLLTYVKKETGLILSPDIFTVVFARRFTAYKRPLLLLSDMERLLKIHKRRPLQIIYAGKAHPLDKEGQSLIKELYRLKKKHHKIIKIAFLKGYDVKMARLLTAGADLWLNNPLPPNEACGTSGMKAALNAVPQLSTPDGWWPEAYRPGQNGWLIPDSRASELYKVLEEEILPLYYDYPDKWRKRMRNAISYNAPVYNSERMVKEYWRRCYE